MSDHFLKTWPEFYAKLISGEKTFEVRSNKDRDFKIDDILILCEWNPETQLYTGSRTWRKITYIMEGGKFGIQEDHCVMGFVTTYGPPPSLKPQPGAEA